MKDTFGKRFNTLRKKHHLTQEEIAKKLNITPQAVSKWENNISAPDIFLLSEIADIFNITIDELLGNEAETVKLVEQENRKDIKSMLLKIRILSNEGDKVNVNLPVSLIIACGEAGINIGDMKINKSMENIDFKQIISLIEQGVCGKLVEIESKDGDLITMYVE